MYRIVLLALFVLVQGDLAPISYVSVTCPTYAPPPCQFVWVNATATQAEWKVLAEVPHIAAFSYEGSPWDSTVDPTNKRLFVRFFTYRNPVQATYLCSFDYGTCLSRGGTDCGGDVKCVVDGAKPAFPVIQGLAFVPGGPEGKGRLVSVAGLGSFFEYDAESLAWLPQNNWNVSVLKYGSPMPSLGFSFIGGMLHLSVRYGTGGTYVSGVVHISFDNRSVDHYTSIVWGSFDATAYAVVDPVTQALYFASSGYGGPSNLYRTINNDNGCSSSVNASCIEKVAFYPGWLINPPSKQLMYKSGDIFDKPNSSFFSVRSWNASYANPPQNAKKVCLAVPPVIVQS